MKKRVAIPVTNDILDQHFGHCKSFALFDIENGTIQSIDSIDAPPHQPGQLPGWLAERGVTDIIAGGMGQRAIQLFNQHNVNVFVGAPRLSARELIEGFQNQTLDFAANYCDH